MLPGSMSGVTDRAPARFWVETLGCPKNQVDSDKLVGTLLADGLVPADAAGDADLVVVNTCAFIDEARQESIDTVLGARRRRSGRRPARGHRLHGRALRRRARRGAARGRRGRRLRRARARSVRRRAARAGKPSGRARPAQPAPPGAARAVGVREGRRGLRPRVRVLRDPVVPRAAALAHARVDRGRGRALVEARRRPRSCSSRRTSPGTAATSASPARSRRCCAASTALAADGPRSGPPAVPLPERAHRPARRDDARAADRRAVLRPVAAARGAGAAAAHEALGERRPLPRRIADIRADEPDAAFRSSFIVGFPGETEDDHDELLGFLEARALDWGGFFPFSPEDGTPAVDARRRRRPGARGRSGCASAASSRSRSPRRARDALVGTSVEVLVDARRPTTASSAAPTARRPRSTASCASRGRRASRHRVRARAVSALGPDLIAEPIAAARPTERVVRS